MAAGALLARSSFAQGGDKPNFIIIFCDDMGYGDLGCFGSTKHRTPNVDRMAEEGRRFTSFYVTSGVCTPSRSSLMTGCYPRRVNMHKSARNEWVLFPVAKKGLHPGEITIADLLKSQGYATACVGKWHLGDQPEFLPTRQGFDYYYGIPYSNDMGSRQRKLNPPLPLMRNEKVIEAPADQNTLTKRYTEEVIKFITANKHKPFFVYLPHTMVHNPVHSSEKFQGKSANGGYGDATEEIDWSTGEILAVLKKLGVDDNTLVIFTSDNGAASRWGGSNLPLPTFAKLAGTKTPDDRIIDGRDIWPLMAGARGAKSPHEAFYYYRMDQLQAVRSGKWKLHLPYEVRRKGKATKSQLRLYDLKADIGEKSNVAEQNPRIVKRLLAIAEKAREDLGDGDRKGNQRPAGLVVTPKPLTMDQ
ncbi:MAG: sulfatase family protein [Planctomycetota bacterium]